MVSFDAPYMWYKAILEQLLELGFQQSPFDPCVFILRDPRLEYPVAFWAYMWMTDCVGAIKGSKIRSISWKRNILLGQKECNSSLSRVLR